MNATPDLSAAQDLTEPQDRPDLTGLVIVVAGAAGAAGPPLVERLARAGATVVAAGSNRDRIERAVADVISRVPSGRVHAAVVDLLDEEATREWAALVEREHGRVDGLVHLVGGWRGGVGIVDADLADWNWLQDNLIRTLQHTSRAFHDAIKAGTRGRLVLISSVQASAPTAANASYAAAKAAAEAWTLAVADSFRDSAAAAVILQIKALLTPAMRAAKPDAPFTGFTPVDELADTIHDLWLRPAAELNGQRL
jgi:NAD(P)-dependent dehydrogenase (short-subunit alcohol dehydrogenase family)